MSDKRNPQKQLNKNALLTISYSQGVLINFLISSITRNVRGLFSASGRSSADMESALFKMATPVAVRQYDLFPLF
jgi:hypothetical protein